MQFPTLTTFHGLCKILTISKLIVRHSSRNVTFIILHISSLFPSFLVSVALPTRTTHVGLVIARGMYFPPYHDVRVADFSFSTSFSQCHVSKKYLLVLEFASLLTPTLWSYSSASTIRASFDHIDVLTLRSAVDQSNLLGLPSVLASSPALLRVPIFILYKEYYVANKIKLLKQTYV